MTPLVPIALFGWPIFVLVLFATMTPRRAVLVGVITGWLFLPMAGYQFADVPDYGKYAAVSLSVLVGSLAFDPKALTSLRPRLVDVPMIVFVLSPFITALVEGFGPLAGTSRVLTSLFTWGIPYAVGRAYFRDWGSLRELAIGVFVGGVAYLPFVWYEIRMSPQLHTMVYGFFQHNFSQHIRYGDYRPIVFMQHGLMVGLWMAAASLAGLWLWRTRSLTALRGVPMGVLVPTLIVTTVLCKSGNAVVALVVGMGVFLAIRFLRNPLPLVLLALVVPTYIAARITGVWSGADVVALIAEYDAERAGSMGARMRQEDVYVAQALKRPLLGWGGGGFIPKDDEGGRIVRGNDAFWIITLGLYGLVSLITVFVALLIPVFVLSLRIPARYWMSPNTAPAVALVVVVALFAIDCLMNGMLNPVYVLALGGVIGLGQFGMASEARACARSGAPQPGPQRLDSLAGERAAIDAGR